MAGSTCYAIGCLRAAGPRGFCAKCWSRIPKSERRLIEALGLGGPGLQDALKDACVFLARKDGFLAPAGDKPARIVDADGG